MNALLSKKGSPVKAVVIATVIDIGLSVFLGFIVFVAYGWFATSNGISWEAFTEQVTHIDVLSPFSLISIGLGSLITVYSANLCARIVNYSEYRYVSVFALSLILFNLLIDSTYYSLTEHVVLNGITLTCVYLGAWLHVRKKYQLSSGDSNP